MGAYTEKRAEPGPARREDGKGSALEFDYIAQNIFLPIYEVIADEIIRETGSMSGTLLDIGCGGGHLGLTLIKKTRHRACLSDINEDALALAQGRAREWGLSDRVWVSRQDVHCMSFPDGFADLVVSRSSYGFWEDKERAFREICRVTAPGGTAYIGGGMGNSEVAAPVREKMRRHSPNWPDYLNRAGRKTPTPAYAEILDRLGLDYGIIEDESRGRWIVIRK
ncbi:MAG: class I SAM-dependent methyltransferase [Clostridiales Family XIII bacterium]|nr:class I SAM-dependent methyltransferase [Clostridiales Family XIII bacterium]